MKARWVTLSLALVVLALGAGARMSGRWQQQLVTAEQHLVTMQFDAAATELEALSLSQTGARVLPWVAELRDSAGLQRLQTVYWRRDYSAVAPGPDQGEADEGPERMLLAANAAYRRVRFDLPPRSVIDRLQEISGLYAEILKRHPQMEDAAYNLEFVARTREELARRRGDRGRGRAPSPAPERTIHGEAGAEPAGADMGEFKIIVPQSEQERQQRPESGAGGSKRRRG
jgi:hypothetical protein